MSQQPLVIIGCGDFGAAAVAHLNRRPTVIKVTAVTVAPDSKTVVHRLNGAAKFEEQVATGWPDLTQAIPPGSTPLFGVIANAEDAASGGVLIPLLRWLKQTYRTKVLVALALPDPQAGAFPYARAYATLRELELLRKEGAFVRCTLRTAGLQADKQAPLFADALLLQARMFALSGTPLKPGYAAFGLEILCSLEKALAPLAGRLVLQVAEEMLRDHAAGPDPVLRDQLHRVLEPVLQPIAKSSHYESFLWLRQNPAAESALMGTPSARGLLRQALYDWRDQQGQHHARSHRITTVQHWYYGLYSGANEGLTALAGRWSDERDRLPSIALVIEEVLTQVRRAHEQSVRETRSYEDRWSEGFRAASLLLNEPDRLRAASYREIHALLEQIDQAYAGKIMESERGKNLSAIVRDLEGLFQRFGKFRPRGQSPAVVVDAVRRLSLVEPSEEPPHMRVPKVDPGVLTWPGLDTRPVRAKIAQALEHPRPPEFAPAILQAATAELRQVLTHIPQQEESDSLRPDLKILNANGVTHSWTVWRSEKASVPRGDGRVLSLPVPWIDGEFPAYAETDPFQLDWLMVWPQMEEAYGLKRGEGLHTLAELSGGVTLPGRVSSPKPAQPAPVSPAPVPTAPAPAAPVAPTPVPTAPSELPPERRQAASTTVLRAMLLGLLAPDPSTNGYVMRTLSAHGHSLKETRVADLSEAIRLLGTDEVQRQRLDQLSLRWRDQLPPANLAAYMALLLWVSNGNVRLGADFTAALQSEVKSAKQRLDAHGKIWYHMGSAMYNAVGSERDDFSLSAGKWRYVKW